MWFLFLIDAATAAPLGAEPAELLADARRALHDLDLQGVRMYTSQALRTPGAHEEEAHYLMGLSWQLDERPADALAIYRETYARYPHGAFNDQLEFGIAETTAATGDPRAALRWLRRARRGRELSIQDEPKFAIDRALFILQKGRMKRGTRKLVAALDATDHDLATWHQARARTYLVNQWLDVADALDLNNPVHVERRAILLQGARDQVLASAHLPHDRYILRQIHRLGTSWERLGDDVVSQHGAPGALPSEARQRVENVWVKASRYYDLGVRHAARVAELDEQARFESLERTVMEKVDGL